MTRILILALLLALAGCLPHALPTGVTPARVTRQSRGAGAQAASQDTAFLQQEPVLQSISLRVDGDSLRVQVRGRKRSGGSWPFVSPFQPGAYSFLIFLRIPGTEGAVLEPRAINPVQSDNEWHGTVNLSREGGGYPWYQAPLVQSHGDFAFSIPMRYFAGSQVTDWTLWEYAVVSNSVDATGTTDWLGPWSGTIGTVSRVADAHGHE